MNIQIVSTRTSLVWKSCTRVSKSLLKTSQTLWEWRPVAASLSKSNVMVTWLGGVFQKVWIGELEREVPPAPSIARGSSGYPQGSGSTRASNLGFYGSIYPSRLNECNKSVTRFGRVDIQTGIQTRNCPNCAGGWYPPTGRPGVANKTCGYCSPRERRTQDAHTRSRQPPQSSPPHAEQKCCPFLVTHTPSILIFFLHKAKMAAILSGSVASKAGAALAARAFSTSRQNAFKVREMGRRHDGFCPALVGSRVAQSTKVAA